MRISACAALLLAVALPAMAQDGRLALVRDGKDPAPIVIGKDAGKLEQKTAARLAAYLKQMSGAEFQVLNAPDALPPRAIVLGGDALELPADLGFDGYVIRRQGSRLHIAGANPIGTVYGVFGFLEDVLGCRWWTHDAEYVPTRTTIALDALDIVERPAFRLHHLYNKEAVNPANDFIYKRRVKGPESFTGGHTLCPYLKPYTVENPNFLPMDKKGERKYNKLHMCYTAAGMPEALAEALEKQIVKRKGKVENTIYFAGMGDWYGGMCLCEPCKNVYQDETWTNADGKKLPGYIAPLITMMNRTGAILEAKYPGVKIGTFAYMSLEAPPAKVRPADNVALWQPHLRHCIVHGLRECPKNRTFLLNLERWLEIAPGNVYIWDYGISFANFLYPFPNIRAIALNLQEYAKLGVAGVTIQGNYVSTGGDMAPLRNYLWGKLLWDPRQDIDTLVESFCTEYYGPAGKDILAYFNALESSVRQPAQVHMNEFEKNIAKKYLSAELTARLDASLKQALEHAGDDATYVRRVKEAMVSLESVQLWKPGPLVEKGDRLVRQDLGDTWERAQDLVAHSRNASPREWGSGRAYRMGFLTYHGGPLATLKRGDLVVKAAPILNGRIRRIIFRGKDLLHLPDFAKKERPNSSGAYEGLNPGSRIYELTGEATPTSVVMKAELGIKHWGSRTLQVAHKTVELTGDNKVSIRGVARAAVRGQKAISARAIVHYEAGKDPAACRVHIRLADGPWQPFKVPSGAPDKKNKDTKPNLPPLTALKIELDATGVIVTDEYLAPAPTGGYLWYDPARGVLVTEVHFAEVPLPREGEVVYLQRELTITPAKD